MPTNETLPIHTLTDEELWDSPLGHRLRRYLDKLLLAEAERITMVAKRKWQQDNAIGVNIARDIVSPDGTLEERNDGEDGDPWAYWQSPEQLGLKEAIKATDGTPAAVQEATKAYIASLQVDERPAADEFPPEQYDMPVGPPVHSDEERAATPLDVAGALSYLLTGHAGSDKGPFAVHEADGFHDEPYVILSVDSMRKVLEEIPEGRW